MKSNRPSNPPSEFWVRRAGERDFLAISMIENHEIANGFAHFGLEPVTVEQVAHQFEATGESYPWFVADTPDGVVGFCRASPWKSRGAYGRTAEIGLYVAPEFQGQGVGKSLYKALFCELQQQRFHTVLAGIALPNEASVRLHESFGMKKVAHLPEVGFKLGAWRDTGYWAVVLPD